MSNYPSPHKHVEALMKSGDEFVLTKKSWNGIRVEKNPHRFAVLDCGPVWVRIQKIGGHYGEPALWITWESFGLFSIMVEGKYV